MRDHDGRLLDDLEQAVARWSLTGETPGELGELTEHLDRLGRSVRNRAETLRRESEKR